MLEVAPVDLLRINKEIRGRFAAMEAVRDRIFRALKLVILQTWRNSVSIVNPTMSFDAHDDVLKEIRSPSIIGIIEIQPLRGFSLIAIDGDLIGAMVDYLCGATTPLKMQRDEFSLMETRIGNSLFGMIMESLTTALMPVLPVMVNKVGSETNAALVAIADGQDYMLTLSAELGMNTGQGKITFAIPLASLEQAEEKLSSPTAMMTNQVDDTQWVTMRKRSVESIPVSISVRIAEGETSLGFIENLKVGDVVPLNLEPIASVQSGKIDLFKAEYGQTQSKMGIMPVNLKRKDDQPS